MNSADYAAFADRLIGHRIRPESKLASKVGGALPRANISAYGHQYLAVAATSALLAAAGTLVLAGALFFIALQGQILAPILGTLLTTLVIAGATFGGYLVAPTLIAAERGSSIEDQLPFALQYMSAAGGPGVGLEALLERVSTQEVYGAVSSEMGRIRRDISILGLDRTTALEHAIARCPSELFKEVLQGIATTLSTGSNLSLYLESKADELLGSHQSRQRKSLENLGLLAEVFVVLAVAMPLFLVIMLVALALFGWTGNEVIGLGFRLFTGLVPALYAVFIAAILIYKPPT